MSKAKRKVKKDFDKGGLIEMVEWIRRKIKD